MKCHMVATVLRRSSANYDYLEKGKSKMAIRTMGVSITPFAFTNKPTQKHLFYIPEYLSVK